MSTLQEKATISLGSAILFGLVSLPATYRLTDRFIPGRLQLFGCPTAWGILVHSLIFGLISFLTMGDIDEKTLLKVKYSFYGTLIFFFLSSPFIYAMVGKVFGTSNNAGCPNIWGVILHSLVYFVVLIGVMYFPPDRVGKIQKIVNFAKGV